MKEDDVNCSHSFEQKEKIKTFTSPNSIHRVGVIALTLVFIPTWVTTHRNSSRNQPVTDWFLNPEQEGISPMKDDLYEIRSKCFWFITSVCKFVKQSSTSGCCLYVTLVLQHYAIKRSTAYCGFIHNWCKSFPRSSTTSVNETTFCVKTRDAGRGCMTGALPPALWKGGTSALT